VVELFPRRAPLPRTLPDVLDRVFQPQYTSRLALDAEFFDRISHIVDLVARIDAALRPDSDIRDDPTYRQIRAHRRIDHLNVVTSSLPSVTRSRSSGQAAVESSVGSPSAAIAAVSVKPAGPCPRRSRRSS